VMSRPPLVANRADTRPSDDPARMRQGRDSGGGTAVADVFFAFSGGGRRRKERRAVSGPIPIGVMLWTSAESSEIMNRK
jgi:hypothetical protein